MWAHPGKQLLFMGAEFGQEAEWSEARSLDWWLEDDAVARRRCSSWCGDLNRVYRAHPALWERDSDPAGFEWIDANDTRDNTFSCDPPRQRRLAAGVRRQLLRRRRTRATGSACRTAGPGGRC